MRTILILFVVFHTGIASSQTVAAGKSTLADAGIPALDRAWTGNDYMQAAKLLSEGKVPLPRLSDEEGRVFLERLTNTGNFSFYRDRTQPMDKRMPDFFNLVAGASVIMNQYPLLAEKGLDVHREFALQLAFGMRMAATGVQLIDEFVPTIPKDDRYEVRMAGMKRAHGGMMKIFAGTEASLSEKRFYTPADLTLLLTTMAETLPAVKKAFSPEYKAEFRKKLETHRAAFPDGEDARAIQQMIDELGA